MPSVAETRPDAGAEGPDWAGVPCRQLDAELWFPEVGYSSSAAQQVCLQHCELRQECLEGALQRQEQYGIWGGLTLRQRRKLLKDRREVAAATSEADVVGAVAA